MRESTSRNQANGSTPLSVIKIQVLNVNRINPTSDADRRSRWIPDIL
jgi:hypothetical protein